MAKKQRGNYAKLDEGLVGNSIPVKTTPSVPAATYSSGDVIVPTFHMGELFLYEGAVSYLMGINGLDMEGKGPEIDIHYFSSNVNIGDQGAACNFTEAARLAYLGTYNIPSDSWNDLDGTAKYVKLQNAIGKGLSNDDNRNIWAAIVVKEEVTYAEEDSLTLEHIFSIDGSSKDY